MQTIVCSCCQGKSGDKAYFDIDKLATGKTSIIPRSIAKSDGITLTPEDLTAFIGMLGGSQEKIVTKQDYVLIADIICKLPLQSGTRMDIGVMFARDIADSAKGFDKDKFVAYIEKSLASQVPPEPTKEELDLF